MLKASMGPRFFKRGNSVENWYITFCCQCFNGAALFQARKFDVAGQVKASAGVLQWGRAFSSAEICAVGISAGNL